MADEEYKVNGEKGERQSGTESTKEKAQAMSYKAFAAAKTDTDRIQLSWRTIQITESATISALRKTEAAARFVLEGEGRANEGWHVFPVTLFVQTLTRLFSMHS